MLLVISLSFIIFHEDCNRMLMCYCHILVLILACLLRVTKEAGGLLSENVSLCVSSRVTTPDK